MVIYYFSKNKYMLLKSGVALFNWQLVFPLVRVLCVCGVGGEVAYHG